MPPQQTLKLLTTWKATTNKTGLCLTSYLVLYFDSFVSQSSPLKLNEKQESRLSHIFENLGYGFLLKLEKGALVRHYLKIFLNQCFLQLTELLKKSQLEFSFKTKLISDVITVASLFLGTLFSTSN